MAIKESGDELDPMLIGVEPTLALRGSKRSANDYLALAIATCGVGYIPVAPGTWGSAVGVILYLLLRRVTLSLIRSPGGVKGLLSFDPGILFVAIELVVITLVTLIGIWAASRVEKLFQKKDPHQVVIDEVAGQLIALLPLPLWTVGPWRWLIVVAFLMFRTFDILKPYPVRRLETLESGLGVILDDLAAGAYAAVLVAIIAACYTFLA